MGREHDRCRHPVRRDHADRTGRPGMRTPMQDHCSLHPRRHARSHSQPQTAPSRPAVTSVDRPTVVIGPVTAATFEGGRALHARAVTSCCYSRFSRTTLPTTTKESLLPVALQDARLDAAAADRLARAALDRGLRLRAARPPDARLVPRSRHARGTSARRDRPRHPPPIHLLASTLQPETIVAVGSDQLLRKCHVRNGGGFLMELAGLEPATSWVRSSRPLTLKAPLLQRFNGRAPGVPQHLPQQSAPRLAEAGPGWIYRR